MKALSRVNLKDALSNDGLSLHLQPVVELPTRQPVHYEAFMRLQMKNGDFLDAGQFMKVAEKGGMMPAIDKKVVFSAVRMLRTLAVLKKRAGLFCNLSSATLANARTFKDFENLMQANTSLADSLVFEITQRNFRHLKAREKERLGKLVDLGFDLSMDQVLDLRIDPDELYNFGFRHLKIPTGILLHASLDDMAPAAPSEMASTLSNSGIALIATETEKESDVMSLIDFGVQHAQGILFAPPRPVKADLLLSNEERARKQKTVAENHKIEAAE